LRRPAVVPRSRHIARCRVIPQQPRLERVPRLLAAASGRGLPSRGLTLTRPYGLCLRCRTADALFKSSAEQLFPALVDSLVKTINHSLTQYQGELLFHLRTRSPSPPRLFLSPPLFVLSVCGLQSTECMRRTRRCEVALAAAWLPSPRPSSPTKTNSASWACSGSTVPPRSPSPFNPVFWLISRV
jgi:hypothetical protein